MKYGRFDNKNKEYLIETPQTLLLWMNYLGSQDFLGMISNIGADRRLWGSLSPKLTN